jgi:hypothetical protein
MIGKNASKSRHHLTRGFLILGLLFYLVKGQGYLYASSDCSGDPIATTAELVLSSTPDYGFYFPLSTPAAGIAFAISENDCHADHARLSAQYDDYARLVLKSCEYAYCCQLRSNIFCKTRIIPSQSSNADPLPAQF